MFPAQGASYSIEDGILVINFQKYGEYVFSIIPGAHELSGSLKGNTEKWRKIQLIREFSASEMSIFGEGYGTAWTFEYAKGSFEVEFRSDAYNHFVCDQYPTHSHWSIDNDVVHISFGQYGKE